ncbi:protein FAM210A-like isoform X2 [Branchiostoma lanceolatum]|uniref:protein FAM210A-like isoform X2 n=1 Tax=Branchiostoma lanceolatum TaxID=7740 RepID=UPI003453B392
MLRLAVQEVLGEGRAVLSAQVAVRSLARAESTSAPQPDSPRDDPTPDLGLPPTIQGLQQPNRAVGPRQARAVFRAAVQAAQAGAAGGSVQGVQAGQQAGSRAVHTQPLECGVSCQGPQGDGCSYAALQYSNMFSPVSNSSCQGVQQNYTHKTTGVLSGDPFAPQRRSFHSLARRRGGPAPVHPLTAELTGTTGLFGSAELQGTAHRSVLDTGTRLSLHRFSFPHHLCTSAPAEQAGKPPSHRLLCMPAPAGLAGKPHRHLCTPAGETEKPPSQRERLKRAVRDYGSTVVVFHVGISLMSLGGFYLAVSSGIDMVALLHKIGVGKTIAESGVATGASTFVIAYAVHKVFAPVRIGITLTCVPFVVRYLRNVGLLR